MTLTTLRPARRLLVAVGAAAGLVAAPLSAPLAATAAGSATGVWAMDGYGTIVAVDNGKAKLYQTTSISCTPAAEYTQDGSTFAADGEQSFTFAVHRDRAELRLEGDVGARHLRRVPKLPAACSMPGATGPLATFDQFWTTFAENYPFFAAKGIDWTAVRAKYRPQVTSDAALFDVLTAMIRPLGDAHTGISTPDRDFAGVRPGTTLPTLELETNVIRPYIEHTTLHGVRYTSYANDRIGYAELPGGIGYLRVIGFLGYGDIPHYDSERAVLDRTLDTILATRPRKLILDLRLNGGGSDQLGLDLASRLTARPYFAYSKRTRNDPADPSSFTAPQPAYVVPSGKSRFTGPMAILTGGSQLSAGETFTMAMMNRTPRPIRIGENTQGVFSDTMDRTLPNGWTFFLPNEVYRTACRDVVRRRRDPTGHPATGVHAGRTERRPGLRIQHGGGVPAPTILTESAAVGSAAMARYFDVHPENPQRRSIGQVVDLLREDGLIAYPTDSCYALGCQLGNKDGIDRIKTIRHLDDRHHFTLVCENFAQLGQFVHISNAVFRSIKAATPGQLHVHPAGDQGSTAPAAAPEEEDGRGAHPGPRGHPGPARRARRAAGLQHPAAPRPGRADDAGLGDQGTSSTTRSTR